MAAVTCCGAPDAGSGELSGHGSTFFTADNAEGAESPQRRGRLLCGLCDLCGDSHQGELRVAVKFLVEIDGQAFEVEAPGQSGHATVDGQSYAVDMRPVDGRWLYSLIVDDCSYEALVVEREDGYAVTIRDEPFEVEVKDPKAARLAMIVRRAEAPSTELSIKAPLPGLVVAVEAEPGQVVKKGQTLVSLEAMKMENDLGAPRDGKVCGVHVSAGDVVEKGQPLLTLE